MSEWIKCSERLPADTEWCLVTDSGGAVNCAAWYQGQWNDWTDAACYNVHLNEITHWMPIPDQPSREAD